MHRKERPAGQRGALFKGRDTAVRSPGLVPPGWGGGRRLSASGALSVGTTTVCGAFLPMLARRSQRGHLLFTDKLLTHLGEGGAFQFLTAGFQFLLEFRRGDQCFEKMLGQEFAAHQVCGKVDTAQDAAPGKGPGLVQQV